MARKSKQPELRQANLSPKQMLAAIKKIDRRIQDIDALDVESINDGGDPRISVLSTQLDTLISTIFGSNTVEYDRYRWQVTNLDTASINMMYETPITEIRSGLERGLLEARSQLQAIRTEFLENLEDAGIGTDTDTNVNPAPAALDSKFIDSEIVAKCSSLFENGSFAEAVELGFKIVRDRLRKLTGYETGSEAFGKGNLHVLGAAAANVEIDFNQAVKFLLMAIDMFRNEKSHTSDASVNDPRRAHQYLAMSSLALALLKNIEIRPD